MINYSEYQTVSADPEASSMIETFRAIGYSIETAVADIIDNSISAGTKNIWIDMEWKGAATWLSVRDDGKGMSETELIQAMRPGSRNPTEQRGLKDLGRFGLGLKTASFSQCRKLTVLSKKESSETVYWTWDLDFVSDTGRWDLIRYVPDPMFTDTLDKAHSGTIVVWNDLDRLVKNLQREDTISLGNFLKKMEVVKKHLAMVFHRFIENNRIKIYFQQREITAWDPFLTYHSATQKLPEERMVNGFISVKGFVLPHKSRLEEDKFRDASGLAGWNAQQGFYIYRNERLLLAGNWLGLFKKEEHYKLARIMVDLPNTLDEDWQIDIKKSVARPPLGLLEQLNSYAIQIRNRAVEVYRHKGRVLQHKYKQGEVVFQPVWQERIRNGKRHYEINREHPTVRELLSAIKIPELSQLLRLVEETIPVPLITIKESEQPEIQGQPFEDTDIEPLKALVKKMYTNLMANGKADEQAKAIIMNIEPFNLYPHLIETLN